MHHVPELLPQRPDPLPSSFFLSRTNTIKLTRMTPPTLRPRSSNGTSRASKPSGSVPTPSVDPALPPLPPPPTYAEIPPPSSPGGRAIQPVLHPDELQQGVAIGRAQPIQPQSNPSPPLALPGRFLQTALPKKPREHVNPHERMESHELNSTRLPPPAATTSGTSSGAEISHVPAQRPQSKFLPPLKRGKERAMAQPDLRSDEEPSVIDLSLNSHWKQYLRAVHEQCVVGFQSNLKLHNMMIKQFRKITAHEDHRVDLEDYSLVEIKVQQISRYLNRAEHMFEDSEDTVSKLHNKVHNLEVKLQEHHCDNRALLEAQFNTLQDVLSRVEAHGHKSTSCPQKKSKKKVQNLTPDDNESSSSDYHSEAESLPSDQEDSDESAYSSNAILQEDHKNISSIQPSFETRFTQSKLQTSTSSPYNFRYIPRIEKVRDSSSPSASQLSNALSKLPVLLLVPVASPPSPTVVNAEITKLAISDDAPRTRATTPETVASNRAPSVVPSTASTDLEVVMEPPAPVNPAEAFLRPLESLPEEPSVIDLSLNSHWKQYLRAVHEQCVVGFQSNLKLHNMMIKQFRKITAHEDHRVDLEDYSLVEIKVRLSDVEDKLD
ncbi:hypothetical protein KEM48_006322 [Puccinia striiformis f. sp. tritici PST-130]|nr:hypothetical protein KEM48_006322 [Puccinia striiformis f. sp. tritici PST-130]